MKSDVLVEIAQGDDELVVNFLRLLVEKGRAGDIAEFADELDGLVAAEHRVLAVEITTAHELTESYFDACSRRSRGVGAQGEGFAQGRPRSDRRDRPPGRIHEARRERARPARQTTPRLRTRKELRNQK